MDTLENLINVELKELVQKFEIDVKYKHVSDFITRDEDSADFIRSVLDDETFKHPDETSPMHEVAKTRSRHSALIFLIGLVLKRFNGLYDSFAETTKFGGKNINLKLWMMTSLAHDKGYYSEKLKKSIPAHKQKFAHSLLTDTYSKEFGVLDNYSSELQNVLAYTYEDIKTYDIASSDWRKNKDGTEKVDHGILGGCIVFNDYLNKLQNNKVKYMEKELFSIKTCALTIAQHNMFKSSSLEEDQKYPNKPPILQYTSDYRISTATPLLLFLALIDTFECVKRFSKEENSTSIQTLTILKKIKISVEKDSIFIDYSDLLNYIKQRNEDTLTKKKDDYLNSIKTLNNWTVLYANPNDTKTAYRITINKLSNIS